MKHFLAFAMVLSTRDRHSMGTFEIFCDEDHVIQALARFQLGNP